MANRTTRRKRLRSIAHGRSNHWIKIKNPNSLQVGCQLTDSRGWGYVHISCVSRAGSATRGRAERREQRAAALLRRTELVSQLGEDRREDAWLLMLDKHAELHGSFGPFHSAEQIEEVNAIISAYTPDEFAAAVALAKSRRL